MALSITPPLPYDMINIIVHNSPGHIKCVIGFTSKMWYKKLYNQYKDILMEEFQRCYPSKYVLNVFSIQNDSYMLDRYVSNNSGKKVYKTVQIEKLNNLNCLNRISHKILNDNVICINVKINVCTKLIKQYENLKETGKMDYKKKLLDYIQKACT